MFAHLYNHHLIELFHIPENILLYIGNFLLYLYILYLLGIVVHPCTHSHLLNIEDLKT